MRPRPLAFADHGAVQRLFERCAEFWTLIEGVPPHAGLAEELMHELPPGVALADKHEPRAWYVGLLLIAPEQRGAGLGARLYEHAESFARERGGTAMRLIVQEQNPRAHTFWTRQGFAYEATTTQQTGRANAVTRLVKSL